MAYDDVFMGGHANGGEQGNDGQSGGVYSAVLNPPEPVSRDLRMTEPENTAYGAGPDYAALVRKEQERRERERLAEDRRMETLRREQERIEARRAAKEAEEAAIEEQDNPEKVAVDKWREERQQPVQGIEALQAAPRVQDPTAAPKMDDSLVRTWERDGGSESGYRPDKAVWLDGGQGVDWKGFDGYTQTLDEASQRHQDWYDWLVKNGGVNNSDDVNLYSDQYILERDYLGADAEHRFGRKTFKDKADYFQFIDKARKDIRRRRAENSNYVAREQYGEDLDKGVGRSLGYLRRVNSDFKGTGIEGMSADEVKAAMSDRNLDLGARQYIAGEVEKARKTALKERGIGWDAWSALVRGGHQITTGVGNIYNTAFEGDGGWEDWKSDISWNAMQRDWDDTLAPRYTGGIEDVKSGEDFLRFAVESMVEQTPRMALSAALGMGATALTGNPLVGSAVVRATNFTYNLGEAYTDQLDEGLVPNHVAAITQGALYAAIDGLTDQGFGLARRMAEGATKGAATAAANASVREVKDMFNKSGLQALKRWMYGMALEGVGEAAQSQVVGRARMAVQTKGFLEAAKLNGWLKEGETRGEARLEAFNELVGGVVGGALFGGFSQIKNRSMSLDLVDSRRNLARTLSGNGIVGVDVSHFQDGWDTVSFGGSLQARRLASQQRQFIKERGAELDPKARAKAERNAETLEAQAKAWLNEMSPEARATAMKFFGVTYDASHITDEMLAASDAKFTVGESRLVNGMEIWDDAETGVRIVKGTDGKYVVATPRETGLRMPENFPGEAGEFNAAVGLATTLAKHNAIHRQMLEARAKLLKAVKDDMESRYGHKLGDIVFYDLAEDGNDQQITVSDERAREIVSRLTQEERTGMRTSYGSNRTVGETGKSVIFINSALCNTPAQIVSTLMHEDFHSVASALESEWIATAAEGSDKQRLLARAGNGRRFELARAVLFGGYTVKGLTRMSDGDFKAVMDAMSKHDPANNPEEALARERENMEVKGRVTSHFLRSFSNVVRSITGREARPVDAADLVSSWIDRKKGGTLGDGGVFDDAGIVDTGASTQEGQRARLFDTLCRALGQNKTRMQDRRFWNDTQIVHTRNEVLEALRAAKGDRAFALAVLLEMDANETHDGANPPSVVTEPTVGDPQEAKRRVEGAMASIRETGERVLGRDGYAEFLSGLKPESGIDRVIRELEAEVNGTSSGEDVGEGTDEGETGTSEGGEPPVPPAPPAAPAATAEPAQATAQPAAPADTQQPTQPTETKRSRGKKAEENKPSEENDAKAEKRKKASEKFLVEVIGDSVAKLKDDPADKRALFAVARAAKSLMSDHGWSVKMLKDLGVTKSMRDGRPQESAATSENEKAKSGEGEKGKKSQGESKKAKKPGAERGKEAAPSSETPGYVENQNRFVKSKRFVGSFRKAANSLNDKGRAKVYSEKFFNMMKDAFPYLVYNSRNGEMSIEADKDAKAWLRNDVQRLFDEGGIKFVLDSMDASNLAPELNTVPEAKTKGTRRIVNSIRAKIAADMKSSGVAPSKITGIFSAPDGKNVIVSYSARSGEKWVEYSAEKVADENEWREYTTSGSGRRPSANFAAVSKTGVGEETARTRIKSDKMRRVDAMSVFSSEDIVDMGKTPEQRQEERAGNTTEAGASDPVYNAEGVDTRVEKTRVSPKIRDQVRKLVNGRAKFKIREVYVSPDGLRAIVAGTSANGNSHVYRFVAGRTYTEAVTRVRRSRAAGEYQENATEVASADAAAGERPTRRAEDAAEVRNGTVYKANAGFVTAEDTKEETDARKAMEEAARAAVTPPAKFAIDKANAGQDLTREEVDLIVADQGYKSRGQFCKKHGYVTDGAVYRKKQTAQKGKTAKPAKASVVEEQQRKAKLTGGFAEVIADVKRALHSGTPINVEGAGTFRLAEDNDRKGREKNYEYYHKLYRSYSRKVLDAVEKAVKSGSEQLGVESEFASMLSELLDASKAIDEKIRKENLSRKENGKPYLKRGDPLLAASRSIGNLYKVFVATFGTGAEFQNEVLQLATNAYMPTEIQDNPRQAPNFAAAVKKGAISRFTNLFDGEGEMLDQSASGLNAEYAPLAEEAAKRVLAILPEIQTRPAETEETAVSKETEAESAEREQAKPEQEKTEGNEEETIKPRFLKHVSMRRSYVAPEFDSDLEKLVDSLRLKRAPYRRVSESKALAGVSEEEIRKAYDSMSEDDVESFDFKSASPAQRVAFAVYKFIDYLDSGEEIGTTDESLQAWRKAEKLERLSRRITPAIQAAEYMRRLGELYGNNALSGINFANDMAELFKFGDKELDTVKMQKNHTVGGLRANALQALARGWPLMHELAGQGRSLPEKGTGGNMQFKGMEVMDDDFDELPRLGLTPDSRPLRSDAPQIRRDSSGHMQFKVVTPEYFEETKNKDMLGLLSKAKRMDRDGVSPREIYRQTFWWRDPAHDKWVSEAPDLANPFALDPGTKRGEEVMRGLMEAQAEYADRGDKTKGVPISRLFSNREWRDFIAAFPEGEARKRIHEMRLLLFDSADPDWMNLGGAAVDPATNAIYMDFDDAVAGNDTTTYGFLLHELDHAIQEANGLSRGGSEEAVMHAYAPYNQTATESDDVYLRIFGEAMARMTQNVAYVPGMYRMTAKERAAIRGMSPVEWAIQDTEKRMSPTYSGESTVFAVPETTETVTFDEEGRYTKEPSESSGERFGLSRDEDFFDRLAWNDESMVEMRFRNELDGAYDEDDQYYDDYASQQERMQYKSIGEVAVENMPDGDRKRGLMRTLQIAKDLDGKLRWEERPESDRRLIKMMTGWEKRADGEWEHEEGTVELNDKLFPKKNADKKTGMAATKARRSLFSAVNSMLDGIKPGYPAVWRKVSDSFNRPGRSSVINRAVQAFRTVEREATGLTKDEKRLLRNVRDAASKYLLSRDNAGEVVNLSVGEVVPLLDVLDDETGQYLAERYPEIGGWKFSLGMLDKNVRGRTDVAKQEIALNWLQTMAKTSPRDYIRDVLSHEIQHFIQYQEGWAPGGNERTYITFADEIAEDARESAEEIQKYKDIADMVDLEIGMARIDGKDTVSYTDISGTEITEDIQSARFYVKALRERISEMVRENRDRLADLSKVSKAMTDAGSRKSYLGLMGEVDSRNTVKRDKMTEEERRTTLKESTEDTPRSEQYDVRLYGRRAPAQSAMQFRTVDEVSDSDIRHDALVRRRNAMQIPETFWEKAGVEHDENLKRRALDILADDPAYVSRAQEKAFRTGAVTSEEFAVLTYAYQQACSQYDYHVESAAAAATPAEEEASRRMADAAKAQFSRFNDAIEHVKKNAGRLLRLQRVDFENDYSPSGAARKFLVGSGTDLDSDPDLRRRVEDLGARIREKQREILNEQRRIDRKGPVGTMPAGSSGGLVGFTPEGTVRRVQDAIRSERASGGSSMAVDRYAQQYRDTIYGFAKGDFSDDAKLRRLALSSVVAAVADGSSDVLADAMDTVNYVLDGLGDGSVDMARMRELLTGNGGGGSFLNADGYEPSEEARNDRRVRSMNKELRALIRDFEGMVKEQRLRNLRAKNASKYAFEMAGGILHNMRTMMTSMDLSAVLRQGATYVAAHPIKAVGAFVKGLQALSETQAELIWNQLGTDEEKAVWQRAGLALEDPNDRSASSDDRGIRPGYSRFLEKLSEKIGVAASERAYKTTLNAMRVGLFKNLSENLVKANGGQPLTEEQLHDIARGVNVATGTGVIPTGAGTGLNMVFWAPKLMASRIEYLSGLDLATINDKKVKVAVGKEKLRALMGMALIIAVCRALTKGDDDDDDEGGIADPSGTNWAAVKVGDTHIDLTGGLAGYVRTGSRLLRGVKVTTKGERQKMEPRDKWEEAARFMRTKFNPVLSLATDLVVGENVIGEPVNRAKRVLVESWLPLSFKDVGESFSDNETTEAALLGSALAILGAGVTTYATGSEKLQKRVGQWRDMVRAGQEAGDSPSFRRDAERDFPGFFRKDMKWTTPSGKTRDVSRYEFAARSYDAAWKANRDNPTRENRRRLAEAEEVARDVFRVPKRM